MGFPQHNKMPSARFFYGFKWVFMDRYGCFHAEKSFYNETLALFNQNRLNLLALVGVPLAEMIPVNLKQLILPTLRQAGINKPCVAIGGIQVQHSATLRHNGANGVAVISAITQARDIAAVVRQLRG